MKPGKNPYRVAVAAFALILCSMFVTRSGGLNASGTSVMPEIRSLLLDNGIRVFHINDELPKTEIMVSISYGKLFENMNNAGISGVIANSMLLSGSGKYKGDSAVKLIEATGGSISVEAGWESITIEIKVLSRDAALAFDILSDLLTDPMFSRDDVEHSKKLVYQDYLRSLDDPASLGMVKLREIIFNGEGYGARISPGSMNAITADSVKSTWSEYARGGNIIVSVSSSIDEQGIAAMCKKSLDPVKAGKRVYYSVDANVINQVREKSANIYLIPSDFEQATVICGVPAPEISYKGNYALEMMNYILGGGSFGSRLMTEIREKRGLAYSVFSYMVNRYKTGLFVSFAQTRNDEVVRVLSLMKENIKIMSEQPVPEDELDWAKNAVTNSFIFTFEKVSQLLANYFVMEYYGLDSDYYNNYTDNIAAVTSEDILRESRMLFDRGLVTVVVGKRELERDLSPFGKVIIVENEGPGR